MNTEIASLTNLVKEIMSAHLSNPNVKVEAKDIPGHIEIVYQAMVKVNSHALGIEALPAPVAAVPARLPAPVAAERMSKPVAASLEGSTIRVSRQLRPGRHLAKAIWPNQPVELTDKFEELIARIGIQRDSRGMPIMAKPAERLMTEDRLKVLDPISGNYYSMLKHHLRSAYNLTHAELLIMYKLTPEQLPETAPLYSTTKSLAAKSMGLGKRNRRAA